MLVTTLVVITNKHKNSVVQPHKFISHFSTSPGQAFQENRELSTSQGVKAPGPIYAMAPPFLRTMLSSVLSGGRGQEA